MAGNAAGTRLEQRWRDLLSVHARTLCEIDRALHPYGLGASDFEVLDVLASAPPGPGDRCRVHRLVGRVHLSQSALSRLLARLERDELVERSECAEDRRGVRVRLTAKGRSLHARVQPLQREVLARMLDGDPGAETAADPATAVPVPGVRTPASAGRTRTAPGG
ncbi:MarR family transcriptional regulator [Streptomyces sp. NPDC008150]|uniref:MarR family winged helix-turn-helix transcriptional regulator n=1 Tax=Streptomyces sp. NPDC008150 TaxID=3364816 RepID=UPI0036F0DCE6